MWCFVWSSEALGCKGWGLVSRVEGLRPFTAAEVESRAVGFQYPKMGACAPMENSSFWPPTEPGGDNPMRLDSPTHSS